MRTTSASRARARTKFVVGVALALLVGCASTSADRRAAEGDADRESAPVTTSGEIAIHNLELALKQEETVRRGSPPETAVECLRLPKLRYLVARVTGEIESLGRALEESRACAARFADASEAWLAVAHHAQTMHRVTEARGALDHAREHGASEARVAPLARELRWASGDWPEVAAEIETEANDSPTPTAIARLARLAHDRGEIERADALYARALALASDPDPIPVAMLELQRGMNLAEASHETREGRAQLARATRHLRSALARLPRYIAAKEHLAEVLSRLGRTDEAIALYQEITRDSSDPEFMGVLAGLLRARGRTEEADALRARARARYDELLAKYPEAMAWHAAEFFMGEGSDLAKARQLLRENASLRPNPESLEALAEAERATGDPSLAERLEATAARVRERL